jgi:hypothetical protein
MDTSDDTNQKICAKRSRNCKRKDMEEPYNELVPEIKPMDSISTLYGITPVRLSELMNNVNDCDAVPWDSNETLMTFCTSINSHNFQKRPNH